MATVISSKCQSREPPYPVWIAVAGRARGCVPAEGWQAIYYTPTGIVGP